MNSINIFKIKLFYIVHITYFDANPDLIASNNVSLILHISAELAKEKQLESPHSKRSLSSDELKVTLLPY